MTTEKNFKSVMSFTLH